MLTKKVCSAGWRTIGGQACYYRSMWESNFARWLQYQVDHEMIASWEHEPHTFWFLEIKRGVRSYLPDFKVYNLDGSHYWVEVKGYWDAKSLTKVKRLAKYYPQEKLILIDSKWFLSNNKKLKLIIPGWESGSKPCLKSKEVYV